MAQVAIKHKIASIGYFVIWLNMVWLFAFYDLLAHLIRLC
ncbi:hypothetical protein HMPREF1580_00796 [Gardnerella vaginalis JCP8070]|nr:hypothetical protein HMPREF1580_00796 [Gardnerella vaginalis JCP8070]